MRDQHSARSLGDPRESTTRVLARYVLFQSPGWLVVGGLAVAGVEWAAVPPWIAALCFAAWFAKDAVLFPFVRAAYERHGPTHGEVGQYGVAEEAIDPEGWVRIGAERWRARLAPGAPVVPACTPIRVVAVEGLLLRVEAAPPPGS